MHLSIVLKASALLTIGAQIACAMPTSTTTHGAVSVVGHAAAPHELFKKSADAVDSANLASPDCCCCGGRWWRRFLPSNIMTREAWMSEKEIREAAEDAATCSGCDFFLDKRDEVTAHTPISGVSPDARRPPLIKKEAIAVPGPVAEAEAGEDCGGCDFFLDKREESGNGEDARRPPLIKKEAEATPVAVPEAEAGEDCGGCDFFLDKRAEADNGEDARRPPLIKKDAEPVSAPVAESEADEECGGCNFFLDKREESGNGEDARRPPLI